MKNITKTTLAVLAAGLVSSVVFTQQAQAAKITGDIGFSGSVSFDTTSLATATTVETWRTAAPFTFGALNVSDVTGNYVTFVTSPTAAFSAPYVFSPGGPHPGLWTVNGFTFDLTSSTVVTQAADRLIVKGVGTVSGNGFDPTPSLFEISTQSAGGGMHAFFTVSNNVVGIPDGGSTVALLGMGLGVIAFIRRKLRLRA